MSPPRLKQLPFLDLTEDEFDLFCTKLIASLDPELDIHRYAALSIPTRRHMKSIRRESPSLHRL